MIPVLVLTVLGSFSETPSQGNSVKGVTRSFLEGARLFLNSDSTVGQGDKKVVNIIEDWDILAEYAGEKLGFYQLLSNDGIIEVRVQTGRIGFKKEFDKGDDPLLIKILDFCKKRRYIQISENTVSYTHLRAHE